MGENPVLDIIIAFLKNTKSEVGGKRVFRHTEKGGIYELGAPDYLLGQIVRQYYLSGNKYYISKEAKFLWDKISDEDIWKYCYRDTVTCNKGDEIEVKRYTGASSIGVTTRLSKGSKFVFKDVFHDEHIIPINVIIKELYDLDNPDYESVTRVLDKICVCRMLKEEDRRIKERVKRPGNIQEVIEKIYLKYNIMIISKEI